MYEFVEQTTGKIITDPVIIEYYTYVAQAAGIPSGTRLAVAFRAYEK